MIFKGFDIKYPEYTVQLPQSKLEFSVRSMLTNEEERLKSSMTSPLGIINILNKTLYECIVSEKPEMQKFLQSISLLDRETLYYGLYQISYSDIKNYTVRCSSCKKEYDVSVESSNCFSINPYTGTDNLLEKKIAIEMPTVPGVMCYIRTPRLIDEFDAVKNFSTRLGYTLDLLNETLIIDRFEITSEIQTEPQIYSDRDNVMDCYLQLPVKDKRIIFDTYTKEFGNYKMDLKFKSFCSNCGNENETTINIVECLFRAIISG